MTTTTKLEEAQKRAEELFFEPVIGFRCLPAGDPRYEVGEKTENSMDWQDDECTGEELGGACALRGSLSIDEALVMLDGYHGPKSVVYIIAGDQARSGQDPNEVIVSNPHVVAIIR